MVKKRSRTERRARERDARKLVRAREKLAALSPGGAPERAIEVASASVVEVKARALPCPQCGGGLRLIEHEAEQVDGQSLRAARMSCERCTAPRIFWFRIVSALPN
jgi:uncharacterized protein with PIN domain